MRAIVPVLVLLALLTGCARHSGSDVSTGSKKAACETSGGKWKVLTQHCDMD